MMNWRGFGELSVLNSINEHGYAIRIKSTNSVEYECYLPDPEYDDCCIHIDQITINEIHERLSQHRDFRKFLRSIGASPKSIEEFKIDELLKAIWNYFDVVDFFELGDIDAIPRDEVCDEI